MGQKLDLLNQYIEAATIKGNASLIGDFKTANKAVKKLTSIYKAMERDVDLAANLLDNLMRNDNASVRSWSCSHALGLNYKVDEAIVILEEIKNNENNMFGYNAGMVLEVYRKQGYLKFY